VFALPTTTIRAERAASILGIGPVTFRSPSE
jgi:hypothetical protein